MSAPPAPARPAPLIRFALWALLLMVLGGVLAVWVVAEESRSSEPPPVVGEIAPFDLVDQWGRAVSGAELAGRPWVADAIFTRCALSCPMMTSRMAGLAGRLPAGVRRVSVSVDPDHDTIEVLAGFATSYGVDEDDDWLFLTGTTEEVVGLVTGSMKLGLLATDPAAESYEDEPITHSTRFVLVDAEGKIRGYYDGFDDDEVDRLVADARAVGGR